MQIRYMQIEVYVQAFNESIDSSDIHVHLCEIHVICFAIMLCMLMQIRLCCLNVICFMYVPQLGTTVRQYDTLTLCVLCVVNAYLMYILWLGTTVRQYDTLALCVCGICIFDVYPL